MRETIGSYHMTIPLIIYLYEKSSALTTWLYHLSSIYTREIIGSYHMTIPLIIYLYKRNRRLVPHGYITYHLFI